MLTLKKAALKLDDEIYLEFKAALAKGRWRSGMPMTLKQQQICSEVISIREAYNNAESKLMQFTQANDGMNKSRVLH